MRAKLLRRLNMYWQMEAFNAAIIIPAILGICFVSGNAIGLLGSLCLLPTNALLVVGAMYWRGKYRRLLGETQPLHNALKIAHRFEIVLLVSCIVAAGICVLMWLVPGLAASQGDRWVATFGAGLAVLEHVNYYHRQLQHFDHWPDFKRLLTGKGFRQAQMAVDLQAWRRQNID